MTTENRQTRTEIVTTQRPKSVLLDMAERYGMEPGPFEATVLAICMPPKATREEFAAFLLVAKEYRLNPLTKEIYAFPKRGGGIVPIVSIDGWISLVNSHPACDGFRFSWEQDEKGQPISCTCTMYRKDRAHPTEVTEYLSECYRDTDPWKMKHRMLRHKAMIQAARYAFGFSGIYDEDEGARIAEARDVTPAARYIDPPDVPDDDPTSGGADEPEASHEEDGGQGQPFDIDAYLARLNEELGVGETPDEVEGIFDDLDVPAALAEFGDEPLKKAFALKLQHMVRAKGDLFPGDIPAETLQAMKLANTP